MAVIAYCISCRSCDGDDHPSLPGVLIAFKLRCHQNPAHTSPSYPRDSYAPIDSTIKTPTVSDRGRDFSRLDRISPPHAPLAVRAFIFPEFPAGFISALSLLPLATRSLRCLPHPVDVKPYTAMLSCLLWLLSCQMSLSCCLIMSPTAECLREKAPHMKRQEQEAYKRDYSAEAVHKRDALRHKRSVEHLNNEAAKDIFRQKNEVS